MATANNSIETLLNEFDVARITGLCVAWASLPAPNFRLEGRI
jgi:hypothetical protein